MSDQQEEGTAVRAALLKGVREGWHQAAQVEVWHHQEAFIQEAVGTDYAGAPTGDTTLFPWTCTSKMVGAVAAARLVTLGRMKYTDSLDLYIPELRGSYLCDLTIADILSHRTAVRGDFGDRVAELGTNQILSAILADALSYPARDPQPEYRVWTHWFLLAVIVERIADETFEHYVQRDVLAPLDMTNTRLCLGAISNHSHIRFEIGPDNLPLRYDSDPFRSVCLPGYSFFGPAKDLVKLLGAVTGSGYASQYLSPHARLSLTTPRLLYGQPVKSSNRLPPWSCGLLADSRAYPGYDSSRLVGHFGVGGSSICFADMDRELRVAILFGRAPAQATVSLSRTMNVLRAISAKLREDQALL